MVAVHHPFAGAYPGASANHAAEHAAARTQRKDRQCVARGDAGGIPKRNGEDQKDQEAEDTGKESPQKFPAALMLSGEEAGKERDNDVDSGNADNDRVFGQTQAVHGKGKCKEQKCRQNGTKKQAFHKEA